MTGFEDLEENDFINMLPDELIIYIFNYIPLDEVLVCENVCQRWRKLVLDPAVWRRLTVVYSGKPGATEISSRNLQIIATHHQHIRRLKLQYEYNYQIIQSIMLKCSNLLSLEIIMCRVAKDFEDFMITSPNLRKLSFKNSLLLGTENLSIQYDSFKDLRYLALSDFGLYSVNCDSLLRCQFLTHILIEKIKDLSLDFIKELIISKQKIVETLHIYGGDAIDDHSLSLLSECTALKDLAIIRCESLTDQGLIKLVKLKCIQHLQIWNNINFTETTLLKTLSSPNLIKLRSLSLSRISNISPVIVDLISEYYKEIKFLAVYQCPRIVNTDYEKQLKSKFRNIDIVLY